MAEQTYARRKRPMLSATGLFRKLCKKLPLTAGGYNVHEDGGKLLSTPSWSSCLLLLPTSSAVSCVSKNTLGGKTSEEILSSEQHETLIRKITTPVMLFLLSPLINITKEFQYAQVNCNCQADNPLCYHPSKVLLQSVDRRKTAYLKLFLHSKGQLAEEEISLLSLQTCLPYVLKAS